MFVEGHSGFVRFASMVAWRFGVSDRNHQSKRLGRYQLLFELARGGMGAVHVARLQGAHGFERPVAIKLLHEAASDPVTLRSFLAEARVTARITHPNVVQTLELGEQDGTPYIVMELVLGLPLVKLLSNAKAAASPLAPALAAWIVAEAAEGLHAAHETSDENGRPYHLVHRDVSPQNLLLGFDGRVLVADFGIAKVVNSTQKTSDGMIKGKFGYMSPEQAGAGEVDRRSDLFALGTVLYESLSLTRAFQADTPHETLVRVIHGKVKSLRELRPSLPEVLYRVVERCMQVDPEARFESARELADELRRVIAELGGCERRDLERLLAERYASLRQELTQRIADGGSRTESSSVVGDEKATESAGAVLPTELAPRTQSLPLEATVLSPAAAKKPASRTPLWFAAFAALAGTIGYIVSARSAAAPEPEVPATRTIKEQLAEDREVTSAPMPGASAQTSLSTPSPGVALSAATSSLPIARTVKPGPPATPSAATPSPIPSSLPSVKTKRGSGADDGPW